MWKAADGRPFANSENHYPTGELECLGALAGKPGFSHNWRTETTRHTIDGQNLERTWIIRKKAYVLGLDWPKDTITLAQVLAVEQAVRGMNEAWWELGDHISVAIGPDTYEPFILDLSCAMHRPGAVGCYKPDDWWRMSAWLKWLGFNRLVQLREDGRHVIYPGLVATKARDYWPGKEWVHIYASRNRPMSGVWARIKDAHYVDGDYSTQGVFTWVVTPTLIPNDKVASYELTWAWSPLEMDAL